MNYNLNANPNLTAINANAVENNAYNPANHLNIAETTPATDTGTTPTK